MPGPELLALAVPPRSPLNPANGAPSSPGHPVRRPVLAGDPLSHRHLHGMPPFLYLRSRNIFSRAVGVTVIVAVCMPWMAVARRNRANMIRNTEVYWWNNILLCVSLLEKILEEMFEVLLCFLEKL